MKKIFAVILFLGMWAPCAIEAASSDITGVEDGTTLGTRLSPQKTVMVVLTAKPDKRDAMLALLQFAQEKHRATPSCVAFHVSQIIDNPYQFLVYEVWASHEAHQERLLHPDVKEILRQLPALLSGERQKFFGNEIFFGPGSDQKDDVSKGAGSQ